MYHDDLHFIHPLHYHVYHNDLHFIHLLHYHVYHDDLHFIHPLQYHMYYEQLDVTYTDQPFVNLPTGTICEFYGIYELNYTPTHICDDDADFSTPYFEIPRQTCQVPTALNEGMYRQMQY